MVALGRRKKTGPLAAIVARSPTKLNFFNAIPLLALALYGVMIIKSAFFLLPTQEQYQNHDTSNERPVLRKEITSTDRTNSPVKVIKPIQLTNDQCESPVRGHFDRIYQQNMWGLQLRDASAYYSDAQWPIPEIRRLSASGTGSYLGEPTQTSLRIIKETIMEYGVTSMIDIPCGDANWIFESYITDHLPLYVGLDVVSAVIDQNKLRFEHHVNKHFHFWDATLCPFPKFYNYTEAEDGKDSRGKKNSVELIHVRDVIQHLTLKQGVSFFCNVFKSGARVLIATTFPDNPTNVDIEEGTYYRNNLSLEPFSFPEGKCIPTHPAHEPDHTCIYNLTNAKWVEEFVNSKC